MATTFIAICLATLGLVGAQAPMFLTEATVVTKSSSDRRHTFECLIDMPNGVEEFKGLPSWKKTQDISVIESMDERREFQLDEAVRVTNIGTLYGIFDDPSRYESSYEKETSPGGTRKLTLSFKNLRAEDSGFYICTVIHDSRHYRLVHDLRVLDSNADMTVELTGISKNIDPETKLLGTGTMIYYQDSKGTVECEVCDGAAEPIVRLSIGDKDITGNVNILNSNFTLTGDSYGMQRMHRCVSRSSNVFDLKEEHNRMQLKCSGHIEDADNNKIEEKSVSREVWVYHKAQKVSETACADVQTMPLGEQGGIICKIQVTPSPGLIEIRDVTSDDSLTYEVGSHNGYSLIVKPEGNYQVITLTFDKVTEDHYHNYMLIVENDAGRKSIAIQAKEGPAREGSGTGSGSLLQASCLLLVITALLQALSLH